MKDFFNMDNSFGLSSYHSNDEDKDKNGIKSRAVIYQTTIRMENRWKKKRVEEVVTDLPRQGESMHIVSNGSFDYSTLVPRIIDLSLADYCSEYYFSTWTMSHDHVLQIIDLFNNGYIKQVTALTGEYFRTRESATYSILANWCEVNGQRHFANKNHSKVTLLKMGNEYFTIEGSANYTANPRIEQFVLSNHKELYYFHREWMEMLLNGQKMS